MSFVNMKWLKTKKFAFVENTTWRWFKTTPENILNYSYCINKIKEVCKCIDKECNYKIKWSKCLELFLKCWNPKFLTLARFGSLMLLKVTFRLNFQELELFKTRLYLTSWGKNSNFSFFINFWVVYIQTGHLRHHYNNVYLFRCIMPRRRNARSWRRMMKEATKKSRDCTMMAMTMKTLITSLKQGRSGLIAMRLSLS